MKEITLIIKKEEIKFKVTQEAYNRWMNEFQPTNKCAPTIRFLKGTVLPESKEVLEKYVDKHFMTLGSTLINEFNEEAEVEVKK